MGNVSREVIDKRFEDLKNYNFTDSLSFNNTTWKETRSIFFRKCLFSQQWMLPFTKIVKGVRILRYSKEVFWVEPAEFTMQKLKGRL